MPPEVYATADDVLAAWPGFARLSEAEQAALVEDANAAVRDHLGRDVLLADRTEVHDGRNRSRLWLKVAPVVAVADVRIDGASIGSTADGSWTFAPETGALVRGPGRCDPRFAPWFPVGHRNVEVDYTAGHDPVPGPVRRAACLAARRLYDFGRASGVYQFEMIGNYSYSLGSGGSSPLGDAAVRLLRPYRASGL